MCLNNKQIAKKIIQNNIYLTLATASRSGSPWASTLYYCTDSDCNFYYISQLESRHSRNIEKNPQVAFAIFDSHQKEGSGNGVQGSGKAYQLSGIELNEARRWYHTTFSAPPSYRMFKIVPDDFYILDPEAKVDQRIKVSI